MSGPSLRAAINEHCRQCVYDRACPGTWRQQVTLCRAEACSLWHVRPQTAVTIPESVVVWYGAEKGPFPPMGEAGGVPI